MAEESWCETHYCQWIRSEKKIALCSKEAADLLHSDFSYSLLEAITVRDKG